MLLADEIAEERQVHGVEVEVPGGYAKVLTAYKTIPLPVWEIHTSDGAVLECSHHHLLATPLGLVKACDLTPGRELMSSIGTVSVVSSADTGRVEPLYDITVDREDGLFYSNGLLSHNSTTFCARQLMHSCLLPGYRALYITPYFEQLKTYADRLIDMERQVRYDVGKQNKYVKHYVNGSKLWLSYACESADHVRGKTVGECVTGDTMVYVSKGATVEQMRIDAVQPGMLVLSSEIEEASRMRVPVYNRVQASVAKGVRCCVCVGTDNGASIVCTPEHLLYVGGHAPNWVEAADLKPGMHLHFFNGVALDVCAVTSVCPAGEHEVYDIQVDRAHNFFANGILAHNCLIDECITGDAKVCCIAGDGGVPTITALKDVKVGWKIRAFSPDTLEVSFEEVTDWMCKGMRHCWTLRTRSGCELTATDNHKMVTVAGKKYVAELVEAVLSGVDVPDLYKYDEASNTLIRESIVAIKDAGEHEVYDITVNRHNTFIVNELGSRNCQNMNPDLVPEILKTQQMSKTPMTVYSGTALTTDTLLEQRWLMSSQGCYHVRSGDGKHWINLHDPDELWKVTDNREYPIDYYTGKPLNVTDGVFVHANQDAMEDGDIGLHIPMIVVPSNCRGTQWAQIYKDVKTQPPAKTLQENFGIAIGDGAKEISEADLKAICVLRHTPQELAGKLATGYYRLVVMGCDWGGSDYNPATKSKQSYSVCCVLGLAPDGKLDILHAKKYAGMDYTVIIGDMLKAYRDYKCNAIASDYGMGAVYTMLIRQHVPWQHHFVMQYAAPNCAAFQSVAGSELPNHYSVNKTEAVTNTFLAVREGGLRAKSWEDMSYYLTDFLAVHREMSDTPTGKKQFKWNRDPRKPDDFLHAVSFAMTLVKVYTGERVVADPSLLRQIRNTLNGRQAGPDLAGIPPVISG